jgi:hypothetical protein
VDNRAVVVNPTSPLPPIDIRAVTLRSTLDRRFAIATVVGSVASLVSLGLIAAIIPNPVFGRTIPPDGAAVGVWMTSAPPMGALIATYVSPPVRDIPPAGPDPAGTGFTIGGVATFFAIGCPVCNKVVLLALGTTSALNVFAPIQPLIGAASLLVLAATLAWSLRRRARGCTVAPRTPTP